MNNKVAILLGSDSDLKYVEASKEYFQYFGIDCEIHILSAHRTPEKVAKFALKARDNGYSILIGAAGMAAHLAGALKAHSTLPVIGVPLPGGILDGLDSLLATLQMPKGVPVATFAIGKSGAVNAALCAAQVLGITDKKIAEQLIDYKSKIYDDVLAANESIQ